LSLIIHHSYFNLAFDVGASYTFAHLALARCGALSEQLPRAFNGALTREATNTSFPALYD
jgi:hypothetical protein